MPSDDVLSFRVHHCLDSNASCQLVVNSITEVQPKKGKKMSFDCTMLGLGSFSPHNSEVKEKKSIIPHIFKSPKTTFSGYKSTKSVS